MHPILIEIGPLTLYTYGLFMAIAFISAIFVAEKRASSLGIEKKVIVDTGLVVLVSSLIGARLLYVAINLDWHIAHPAEIILSRSGFVFQGGVILGFIGGALYVKRKGLSILQIADLTAPSIALGTSIGRIGCFANGCCYGKPLEIFGISTHHPTQIYSSAANLAIFFILLKIKGKADGSLFFCWLLIYSLFRFFIEFIRADFPAILFGLTLPQILCIILGTLSISILSYRRP
jgi:phosphatidylglycerol:prolipoprotein diacylglycerol transferase